MVLESNRRWWWFLWSGRCGLSEKESGKRLGYPFQPRLGARLIVREGEQVVVHLGAAQFQRPRS